ncbi:amidohydrolase [Bacillus sp. Marseille-Q3570]|uniref:amidohydrolase n=1 Tax=Bacillus sp. Marseille-Q3570 TaxID=2963522 RepID=UPI0021B79107|nr:amidohydrolase [Bacillus sp. Marseille-Q3570]
MNIEAFVEQNKDRLSSWRRQFHQYPEVGWTEYVTTYRIHEILSGLGFTTYLGKDALVSEVRMGVPSDEVLREEEERALAEGVPEAFLEKMKGGHTGVVATFDTGKKGPHIAMRYDIDALPINESESQQHQPAHVGYRSKRDGQMHACGHDGHTTIGLGVASFLKLNAENLSGRFTLLFQPAEEGSRGAKAMVEKGWLDDADYFLSGHIGIHMKRYIGQIAATTSGFLATTKCDVTFTGLSAHAGKEPEKGRNALLAASSAALNLHGIARHGDGKTRINVGTLNAGTGRNIIPDHAEIQLETRGETTELNEYMITEARRIIEASAAMYNVEAEIKIVGEGIDATSDESFIPIIQHVGEESPLIESVLDRDVIGASEDVAYMMERVQQRGGKATFLLFGTPLANGHHHSEFDYQEDVLAVAVDTLARTIVHLQQEEV